MPKTPSYRQRTGYTQAIVTLTDSVTKRRKAFWLGEFGSTASREAYPRVVAERDAHQRRWPRLAPTPSPVMPGLDPGIQSLTG